MKSETSLLRELRHYVLRNLSYSRRFVVFVVTFIQLQHVYVKQLMYFSEVKDKLI